jgi:hypothetical protein
VHLAADDGIGFFHALDRDEKENLLRRQIEIGVDEDDEFTPGRLRSTSQGLAFAGPGKRFRSGIFPPSG